MELVEQLERIPAPKLYLRKVKECYLDPYRDTYRKTENALRLL